MDTTDWIALGQLVTAVLGIIGVIVTLRLNTRAVRLSAQTLGLNVDAQHHQTDCDNRAHWWERYTWAEELRLSPVPARQELGWDHMPLLIASPLATSTEKLVIQLIALRRVTCND